MIIKKSLFLVLCFLCCITIASQSVAQEKQSKEFQYIRYQEARADHRTNLCIAIACCIASNFARSGFTANCLTAVSVCYSIYAVLDTIEAIRIKKQIEIDDEVDEADVINDEKATICEQL